MKQTLGSVPPLQPSAFPAGKAAGEGRIPLGVPGPRGACAGSFGELSRSARRWVPCSSVLVCFCCCCRGLLAALPGLCELLLYVIANVKAVFLNSGSLNSFNFTERPNCI